MARPSNDDRLAKVHADALIEFDEIQAAMRAERLQCLQDRRFYSVPGAQWEGAVGEQFENRPKFEINKTHLAVIRIINEYRNNRITVDFVPKDGKPDALADTCDGLYRASEQDSYADEAYDNAFEEACGGGFGAYRLRAVYEDEEDPDNDYQCIRIEPIYDADSSVFFNLDAKRQDKADAKRCYVLTSMSTTAYRDEYDDDPASWPKEITDTKFDWSTPDVVFVCELYKIEEKTEKAGIWTGLDGSEQRIPDAELDEDEDRRSLLLATGHRRTGERKFKRKRVHKYLLSGGSVLEDCGYIPGTCIPIVPQYGKRWYVDGIERCMGHVRLAKDAQRLMNMERSKLAEIVAISSVEKPIMAPEQMVGHTTMWADDTIKNYPYLLANLLKDAAGNIVATGPMNYTRSPQIPPALAAMLQITEQDLKDLLGNQESGEQLQPGQSGIAMELAQNRIDMQAYIYMSNAARARQRGGEIWLSMAREIYVDEGRLLKTVGAQKETNRIELLRMVVDKKTGAIVKENDFSRAKMDVAVEVGPSSSSRRSSTVRSLNSMMGMTDDPETKQVLGAMSMMNMEGEGIDEARDFFRRKLVRMGVVKPTDQEQQDLASEAKNQQPDANVVYLQSAAEAERAKAVKAQADTGLSIAKAEQARAETAETLAGIGREDRRQVVETADMIAGHLAP